MTKLIGLALALTNLAEAEGRAARRSASRMVSRTLLMLLAGAMFLLGLGFALTGLFLALEPQTGAAGASLITGLLTMTLAGGGAWLTSGRFRRRWRARRPGCARPVGATARRRAVGRRPWLWLGGSLLAGAVLSGVVGGRRGRRYTCRCSA